MGKLGFNFDEKRAAAEAARVPAGDQPTAASPQKTIQNVESGVVITSKEQNEQNEYLEVSDLLLAIEQRNRVIRNLRILLLCSVAFIACLVGFVMYTQPGWYRSEKTVATHMEKLDEYSRRFEALQGQYDEIRSATVDDARKCSQELMTVTISRDQVKNQLEAANQQMQEHNTRYDLLLKSFEDLKNTEDELKFFLKKSEDERVELIKQSDDLKEQLKQMKTTTTTKRPRTTTTPAPSRSFFDTPQLRKINDIVKEIESVGRVVGRVLSDAF
ncbi:hypothetical protein TKK_0015182 [Trichogramma kaykai]|uniref:Uncharacterized protein n=1 Tax=Trichogramma kaykai TaxID=54128 RepID=A0ABD2WB04_9HYME